MDQIKKIFALSLVGLLLSILACKNPHESKIQEIDHLLFALDSSRTLLHNLDTGLIFRRIKSCDDNIKLINSLTDTIDRESVFVLDEYARYQKFYNKTSNKLRPFYEEIETLPMQLNFLKKDLSKNLIDEKDAVKYLKNESVAALTLSNVIVQIDIEMKGLNEPFLACEEKILTLIEQLKASNKEDLDSES